MKKKVYLISWYFPSFPGGAEKSILEELKNYKSKNFDTYVISFDEKFKFGKFEIKGIKGYNYRLKYLFNFSRYYTYLFNKNHIFKILSKYKFNSTDLILVQGIFTPYVSKFCIKNKLTYNYYIRDENNLNEFNNYWVGFKKYLKYLKDLIDFIPLNNYMLQNKLALLNANKIISNSKFIANLLLKKFNLNSKIILPEIDLCEFEKVKLNKSGQKYITFIGGHNAMKGYDIVLKIAKQLPNYKFLIIGNYPKKYVIGNITYLPWQKHILEVYKKSKLILVPSRWKEAYGRVVMEANCLNIPVISSGQGGLVEANEFGEIIYDFENVETWIEKIKVKAK